MQWLWYLRKSNLKNMASVSSLCSQLVIRSRLSDSVPLAQIKQRIGESRNPSFLCYNTISSSSHSLTCIEEKEETKGTKRRDALFQIVLAAVSLSSISSVALADSDVAEKFRIYSDEENKYKILIPPDWKIGTAEADGIRQVTAFYPEDTFNSNVSVLITGLGPDFTRLESFGKVDEFAETLIGGLDRSWQKPPGVKAKLIDSKSANGLYYIEYTLQIPGESIRHIITALGVATSTWYNRLYTITGQFFDEDADKYKSSIEKTVKSFRFI